MAQLQISLLGGVTARYPSGAALALPGRKATALLAYLALQPGQACPREKLTALLWSERGEPQARSSLRQALSELRKALAGLEPPVLEAGREAVGLAAEAVAVDVLAFERLVGGGDAAALGRALELYKGEFLDGLAIPDPAFEAWQLDKRRRLARLFIEAAGRRLADLQEAGGRAVVEPLAQRLLAADPLHETAHRALMGLYARGGERSLAVRQYETCAKALDRELGAQPEPETQALYRQIVAGEAPEKGAAAQRPAVAVLPFEALSEAPAEVRFADGLTRGLITELGRFSTLSVIAAATMLAYRGRRVGVAEVGREQGAGYVLDGSLQTSGRRLRITAQLTDVNTGRQVWADRFECDLDGDLDGGFDVQDEITQRIAANLYMPLLEYGARKARQKPGGDAYTLYLRALHHIEKPTPAGIAEAKELCRQVVERDPEFALVYEILMWTHLHAAWNGWVADPESELRDAHRQASQGMALDNKDPYVRGGFGFIDVFLGQRERGLKALQAAVELVPSDYVYHTLYGGALAFAGEAEAALGVLEEAERLGPNYHVTRLFEGDAHFVRGECEAALGCYEQFLLVLPHFSWALLYVAACQVELGRLEEARTTLAEVRRLSPAMDEAYLKTLLRGRDPAFVERLLADLNEAGLS